MKQSSPSVCPKTALLLLVFSFFAQCLSAQCTPANRLADSLALVALYNSTDGANWSSPWDLLQPMHTWTGITLSPQGCVDNLFIDGSRGLNGTLPAQLGNLTNIDKEFWIVNNPNLSGTIPASIGNLQQITKLYLFGNNLSGSIPSSIGNLSSLIYLDFCCNNLTGAIPSSIGNLDNLYDLVLNENNLTGSIPATIGDMASLGNIWLINNQISGTIPTTIGNISTLKIFQLFNNNLTGNIPASVGNLINLEIFQLALNDLSGCIPPELKNICTNVTNGDLSGNPNLDTQSWANFCAFNEGMCTSSTYESAVDATLVFTPNPVADQLNIMTPSEEGYAMKVQVLDMWGRLLLTSNTSACLVGESCTTLDVSTLHSGVYTLIVQGSDKMLHGFFVKR